MKKAEERARQAYPYEGGIKGMICEQSIPIYIKGYEQAEKDLALTWEDVAILITIYEAGIDNGDYRRYNDAEWMKEYSQDILRRFNQWKEEDDESPR